MRTVRAIVMVSLLLCSVLVGGLVAAGPIGASTGSQDDLGPAVDAQTNGTVDESDGPRNGSLGGEVSSFMQITAASAEGAVDSGMWRASVNDSGNDSERNAEIAARIEYLWERFDDINAEKADLRQDRNNNSSVSYVARASRLGARIDSFQTSVNQTVELAAEQNVSETEAARLQAAAESLGTPNLPAVDEDLATGTTPPGQSSPQPTVASTPTATTTATTATTTATTATPTVTPTATTTATPENTTTTANATDTPTDTPAPANTTTATPTPRNTTATETTTTTATPTVTDTPADTETEAPTTTTPTDDADGGDGGEEDENDGSRGDENESSTGVGDETSGSATASATTATDSTATDSSSTTAVTTTATTAAGGREIETGAVEP